MTVEEFLKNESAISLKAIAFRMFPNNKSANTYLVNKLNQNDNRRFTKKDAENALKVLKDLSIQISDLELE